MGIGDWGFGDWGLGIGPNPNPQSPIPNPQIPISFYNAKIKYSPVLLIINLKNFNFFNFDLTIIIIQISCKN